MVEEIADARNGAPVSEQRLAEAVTLNRATVGEAAQQENDHAMAYNGPGHCDECGVGAVADQRGHFARKT